MPASLNGTRAASTTLVKTRGDRDSPKGRALYWYGPGGKGNCSFVDVLGTTRGSVAEQNKKETKDSPPRPPPGEGVVRSPSPEEQDPKAPGRPSQGRRLPWRFTGLAGAGTGCAGLLRPAPRCRSAVVQAAVVAELERRWRQQEGALGDEQTEGLQPAVGWRQQQTAGAGCDETPPSASVQAAKPNRPLQNLAHPPMQ